MTRAPRSTNLYILDAMVLLRDAPRTKTEISVLLDVSPKAVNRTVDALAARRLIEVVGRAQRHGERGAHAVLFGWARVTPAAPVAP